MGSLPLLTPSPGKSTDLPIPAHCGSLRTPLPTQCQPSSSCLFLILLCTPSASSLISMPGTDLSAGNTEMEDKGPWAASFPFLLCSHYPFPPTLPLSLLPFLHLIHVSLAFLWLSLFFYPDLLFLLPLPFLPSVSVALFLIHSYSHSFVHSANSDVVCFHRQRDGLWHQ